MFSGRFLADEIGVLSAYQADLQKQLVVGRVVNAAISKKTPTQLNTSCRGINNTVAPIFAPPWRDPRPAQRDLERSPS